MERGERAYYVDCTKSGNVWDMTLPTKVHHGNVAGVGNELISVRTAGGYICFNKQTKRSREGNFMLVEFDEGQSIIASRQERFERAYGAGARVVSSRSAR